jgi:carbamate kinase
MQEKQFMQRTLVLAIGGNALTMPGQAGTMDELEANALSMAGSVKDLLCDGWRVVIVHGNGPQVGNLAYQQEESAGVMPTLPLFVLDSMTQGEIGSLLGLAVRNLMGERVDPVAVVTHVLVDPADPAFENPTKPIGPFYEPDRAEALAAERGWALIDDSGRGLRRAVASPHPRGIVELAAIRTLIDRGSLVIACGGGGVPVAVVDGHLRGVDAVIDKDLAAQQLAIDLGAEVLAMVTGVSHVFVDWGTPQARNVDEMTVAEAAALAADGQFPPGSMGPKVSAGLYFLARGGKLAVITSPDHIREAVLGNHGTRIVPGQSAAVA